MDITVESKLIVDSITFVVGDEIEIYEEMNKMRDIEYISDEFVCSRE